MTGKNKRTEETNSFKEDKMVKQQIMFGSDTHKQLKRNEKGKHTQTLKSRQFFFFFAKVIQYAYIIYG